MPSAIRRTAEDYAEAFSGLLPQGAAWPRELGSVLMRFVAGLAAAWARVDGRAADLLERESDPRSTLEMLDSWEAAFGLPDPCVVEPLTVADRRTALLQRMTTEGGQSRAYFIAVAAALGYTITITEYAPYMGGISRGGDTRDAQGDYRWMAGPAEIRFMWTVHVGLTRLTWLRGGAGAGGDHHLTIALATDLECTLRRIKPAHTELFFDYSGLASGGSMAGTP